MSDISISYRYEFSPYSGLLFQDISGIILTPLSPISDATAAPGWVKSHVPIPAQNETFNIVIRGIVQSESDGNEAIDDLIIKSGICWWCSALVWSFKMKKQLIGFARLIVICQTPSCPILLSMHINFLAVSARPCFPPRSPWPQNFCLRYYQSFMPVGFSKIALQRKNMLQILGWSSQDKTRLNSAK